MQKNLFTYTNEYEEICIAIVLRGTEYHELYKYFQDFNSVQTN